MAVTAAPAKYNVASSPTAPYTTPSAVPSSVTAAAAATPSTWFVFVFIGPLYLCWPQPAPYFHVFWVAATERYYIFSNTEEWKKSHRLTPWAPFPNTRRVYQLLISREERWSDIRWVEDNIFKGLHLESYTNSSTPTDLIYSITPTETAPTVLHLQNTDYTFSITPTN